MAFQATSSSQETKNRNLLEQLEEQKKRLQLQSHGAVAATPTATTPTKSASVRPPAISQVPPVQPQQAPASILYTDQQHMTPQQRAALQHAHANSVGFYITQDSSFGNLILPVLPRFDKTAAE